MPNSASTPIAQGTLHTGLPLGDYTIKVDATDAGTSISDPNAGTLQFLDEPAITIAADHTVVSYDAPTVTISGQVTFRAPDGTITPYATSPLMLIPSFGNGVITVTTDAKGDYTDTATPLGGDSISAALNPTATTGVASSPTISFTLHVDPVKLAAAKLSAKTIVYGTKETLSGTVTYEPGTKYVPLEHRTVQIDVQGHAPRTGQLRLLSRLLSRRQRPDRHRLSPRGKRQRPGVEIRGPDRQLQRLSPRRRRGRPPHRQGTAPVLLRGMARVPESNGPR